LVPDPMPVGFKKDSSKANIPLSLCEGILSKPDITWMASSKLLIFVEGLKT
jgi:hypothetical protein